MQYKEQAASRGAEASDLRAMHAELQDSYHRLNGELHNLREYVADLEQDRMRLRERENELGEVSRELAGVRAEVERLNELIRAMENTKAWRLHTVVERLRGRS